MSWAHNSCFTDAHPLHNHCPLATLTFICLCTSNVYLYKHIIPHELGNYTCGSHTHTHTHTHKHTHMLPHRITHTHTHTHTHNIHTLTHTHTHAHIHMHKHTYIHVTTHRCAPSTYSLPPRAPHVHMLHFHMYIDRNISYHMSWAHNSCFTDAHPLHTHCSLAPLTCICLCTSNVYRLCTSNVYLYKYIIPHELGI